MNYIDDHELVTAPVYNGTNGMQIVKSSYTVFGNNGSTATPARWPRPATRP